jgi:hypothetical protein
VNSLLPESFDRGGWTFADGQWTLTVVTRDGPVVIEGHPPNEERAGFLAVRNGQHPDGQLKALTLTGSALAIIGDAITRFDRHGDFKPPTSVWNVRGMKPELVAELGIVYCGRKHRSRDALANGKLIYDDHPLNNPYRLPPRRTPTEAEKIECMRLYRQHLHGSPELMTIARQLRGSRLGCWCGEWDGLGEPNLLCHCVEIARVAEAK